MKNFIFALLATLSSFSVSAQFTITTLFYESFENVMSGNVPNTVVAYDNDSCTLAGASSFQDIWNVRGRSIPDGMNDSCVGVRSTFSTNPPCQSFAQANDWLIITEPIEITNYTWLKYWRECAENNSYGIYFADTILPNNGDNFLNSSIFIDSFTLEAIGVYDSISLSAYAGQTKYIAFRHFSDRQNNGGYVYFDDIEIFNRVPVGITKMLESTFIIYPNPTNNAITVESEEMGSLYVYNSLGQLLLQQNKNEVKQQVNIADLQNGIYIVQLQTEKGTISHKIQKQ